MCGNPGAARSGNQRDRPILAARTTPRLHPRVYDEQTGGTHMMIDHALATVPPGHPEVSYMSDHLPLRLDLAAPRPFSTPQGAMPVPVQSLFGDTQWLERLAMPSHQDRQ